MYLNNLSSRYNLVLQVSPLSNRVNNKPLSPVMVAVLDLVKK